MTDVPVPTREGLDPEWLTNHFDHHAPAMGHGLYDAFAWLRENEPIARSDKYEDGFYVLSTYDDVLAVAQDWETWSSAQGMSIPHRPNPMPTIPEEIDPPLHREYKRLINKWFRPVVVQEEEARSRALITSLIDEFIESGSCEFMADFARPLPGRMFFETVLHAPAEEAMKLNRLAGIVAESAQEESSGEALMEIVGWIAQFLEQRGQEPPRNDVVDAVVNAEIDGRPIEQAEIFGIIMLLLFGGLDTTAGVLGAVLLRFCQDPSIPALLREQPELIPQAVEEMLRMDGSFVTIARTATRDTKLGDYEVKAGKRVLLSWASANRDPAQFDRPDEFDPHRAKNPHIAFGAGPHRCAGSNLARMNLRIAIGELTRRLHDIRLDQPLDSVEIATGFSRAPRGFRIAFTPGPREQ